MTKCKEEKVEQSFLLSPKLKLTTNMEQTLYAAITVPFGWELNLYVFRLNQHYY